MTEKQVPSMEQLNERYRKLNDLQIRAQADLDHAQNHLDTLQRESVEQFGTSDLKELESKLESMESENRKIETEYEQHLARIESELLRVEQEYQQEQG